jgi:mono/diheme cytochrome c family protein
MSDETKNISQNPDDGSPAARSPAPVWIFALTITLIYLGAVYFDYHGGWFNSEIYAPYKSADELEMYQPKSCAATVLAQGKGNYERICGACHSVDGVGKPGQAPPLAGSEWVNAKGFKRLAEIPLLGLNGMVEVKGQSWNLNMAAMGAGLSDADLAGVLTYIRTSWGNKGDDVNADDVKAVRATVGGHSAINGEQLKTIPE